MTDRITIACSTGIFILESSSYCLYRGAANGVECRIERLTVTISFGTKRTSFNINGTIASSIQMIGKKIDQFCNELFYNDERDVKFITTKNGKLAYYCYNTHLDTTPVIFVHGGPGDGANTKRARDFRLMHPVFAYDQMGCGRSDKIKDLKTWNYDSFADELSEFIDVLGFKKVILVGESWGGGLSTLYALDTHCEKVESLILISPFLSSSGWVEEQNLRLSLLDEKTRRTVERYNNDEISRKQYVPALGDFFAHYFFSNEMYRDIAMAIAEDELDEVEIAMQGTKDFRPKGNFDGFELVDRLSDITARTLILCGDCDILRVSTAEKYRDAIKDCRLQVIKNAGHLMAIEQLEQVKTAVSLFIQ